MTRLRDDGYLEIGAEPRDDSDVVVASCFVEREVMGLSGRPDGQDGCEKEPIIPVGVYHSGVYDGSHLYMWPILVPAETVAERFNGGRVAGSDRQIWYMIEAILTADGRHVYLDRWLATHTGEGEEIDRE